MMLLLLLASLSQTPAPAQPAAGNADNGKRLFAKHTCYYCHGTAGQGGIAGARLAAVARNTQGFIRYVRRPTGQMPAYSEKILSDQDLTDIFAYVRSLPAAKAVSDIPLLNHLKQATQPPHDRPLGPLDDARTYTIEVGQTLQLIVPGNLTPDPEVEGSSVKLLEVVDPNASDQRHWEVRAIAPGRSTIRAAASPPFVITFEVRKP